MTNDDLYYDCHVFCCINERAAGHKRGSCARSGAGHLHKYMKARAKELGFAKTRINKSGCLDRCELGPCMVIYPQGVWYRYESEADIDDILESHMRDGKPVERLLLRTEDGP